MCVRSCDCNNCYKKRTCMDCVYCRDWSGQVNCNIDGIKGCPYKIPYPNTTKGSAIEPLEQKPEKK